MKADGIGSFKLQDDTVIGNRTVTGIARDFEKSLKKQGLKFALNTKVLSAEKQDGKIILKTESAKGGKEATVSFTYI